ncbi:MAG: hypothetical protein P5677_26505, partial [Limnospira sp. PMC 1245.20]|nr:hypothetical protein [Limnospira sp. PMC 1245.20]
SGGVVTGSNNVSVYLPPESFEFGAVVSITGKPSADVSLPLPGGLNFLQAFDLSLGGSNSLHPFALAIPAPGLAEGDKVYLFRTGGMIGEGGFERNVLGLVDVAIVGVDGFA